MRRVGASANALAVPLANDQSPGRGTMKLLSESTEMGVVERGFEFTVDGEDIPGILWSPEGASGRRPTILIGHGGTQHKRVANVLALARRFVRHMGYNAVAIDAPGHGDRVTDPEAAKRRREALQARIAGNGAGPARAFSPEEAAEWEQRTSRGGIEWRTLLDELDAMGHGPNYGYWGVSMGTAIGLPFVSSEPRISAAILGLAALRGDPGSTAFAAAARNLSIPILFVFQWDDELMSREAGLALFDAIGSKEKAMHVFPGGHIETPLYERGAYEAFYARHFGEVSGNAR
jgi:hypothetical protein